MPNARGTTLAGRRLRSLGMPALVRGGARNAAAAPPLSLAAFRRCAVQCSTLRSEMTELVILPPIAKPGAWAPAHPPAWSRTNAIQFPEVGDSLDKDGQFCVVTPISRCDSAAIDRKTDALQAPGDLDPPRVRLYAGGR